jgi:hypothetical protein
MTLRNPKYQIVVFCQFEGLGKDQKNMQVQSLHIHEVENEASNRGPV